MKLWQVLTISFGLSALWTLKRKLCPSLLLATLLIGYCQSALAQGAPDLAPAVSTLFQGVRIFDGKSAALSASSDVLITGNRIERISASPIDVDPKANVRVVSGDGRVLMPGLIDAHWHAALVRTTPAQAFGDLGFNTLVAGAEATDTLMRGFTTIRDMAGRCLVSSALSTRASSTARVFIRPARLSLSRAGMGISAS